MFATPTTGEKQWSGSLLLSLALHAAFVVFALYAARPVFVTASLAAAGNHGASANMVYLAPTALPALLAPMPPVAPAQKPPKLLLPQDPASAHRAATAVLNRPPKPEAASQLLAGSQYGSMVVGSESDIRPALPELFPDPPIYRMNLPPGVVGDVIVEVTIDVEGNVTEMHLVRGLGYGVDERVLATVQNWRFRPASRDGVPIVSKEDLYFHVPS